MSANVFFVAVQCCQCSTMQVKQRSKKSKSSNKWTCVVCNEKQSVRKVFAQGSMAKQLRPFVQSFNMNRLHTEQPVIHHHADGHDEKPHSAKKPRIDWSYYLDNPNEISKNSDDDGGGDFGPKILTELPMEFFSKQALLPKQEEERCCKRSMSEEGTSKCRDSTEEKERDEDDEPRRKGEVSKWKDYIAEDDEDEGDIGRPLPRFSNGRFAARYHGATVTDHDADQTVEDDVHPDFL